MNAEKFQTQLISLLSKIKEKATEQFKYNEEVNVPENRIPAGESAIHAIRQGIASGVNFFFEWDCCEAIETAHSILEDSNCHREAAAIRRCGEELAPAGQLSLF